MYMFVRMYICLYTSEHIHKGHAHRFTYVWKYTHTFPDYVDVHNSCVWTIYKHQCMHILTMHVAGIHTYIQILDIKYVFMFV